MISTRFAARSPFSIAMNVGRLSPRCPAAASWVIPRDFLASASRWPTIRGETGSGVIECLLPGFLSRACRPPRPAVFPGPMLLGWFYNVNIEMMDGQRLVKIWRNWFRSHHLKLFLIGMGLLYAGRWRDCLAAGKQLR